MSQSQERPRISFDCTECGKNLQLTETSYNGLYKGHTQCLSCRQTEKVERLVMCEHGNYSCYICEVKLLKLVISDLETERRGDINNMTNLVKLSEKQFNSLEILGQKYSRKEILTVALIGTLYKRFPEDEMVHIRVLKEMEFDDLLLSLANGYKGVDTQ